MLHTTKIYKFFKTNISKDMAIKIKINRDTCIGCGACAALCPDVFEVGDDFKARVKDGADLSTDNIRDAAASCPVEAIEIDN